MASKDLIRAYLLYTYEQNSLKTNKHISANDMVWLQKFIKAHRKGFAKYVKLREGLQELNQILRNSPNQPTTPSIDYKREDTWSYDDMVKQEELRLKDREKNRREIGYVELAIKDGIVDNAEYEKILGGKNGPNTGAAYKYATDKVADWQREANKTFKEDKTKKVLSVDGLYGRKSQRRLKEYNEVKQAADLVRNNVSASPDAATSDVVERAQTAWRMEHQNDFTTLTLPLAQQLNSISRVWNPAEGDAITYGNFVDEAHPGFYGNSNQYRDEDLLYNTTGYRDLEYNEVSNYEDDLKTRYPIQGNGVTLNPVTNNEGVNLFMGPDSTLYRMHTIDRANGITTDSLGLVDIDGNNIIPLLGGYAWLNGGQPYYYTITPGGYKMIELPVDSATYTDLFGNLWNKVNGLWQSDAVNTLNVDQEAIDRAKEIAEKHFKDIGVYKIGGSLKRRIKL